YLFVFQADILMSYAITAIIVALILEKGGHSFKWIGWLMGSLHGLVVIVISAGFGILLTFDEIQRVFAKAFSKIAEENVDLFLHGSYWDQVMHRFSHFFDLRMEAFMII